MQIQISWLLQKVTDLGLHCLQRQGVSRFSRTKVKVLLLDNMCIEKGHFYLPSILDFDTYILGSLTLISFLLNIYGLDFDKWTIDTVHVGKRSSCRNNLGPVVQS